MNLPCQLPRLDCGCLVVPPSLVAGPGAAVDGYSGAQEEEAHVVSEPLSRELP